MIKRKHTKNYERWMWYNKVEYSTATGPYCMVNEAKVPFCMPELSSINIIRYRFHFDNDKGEYGIGYDMIIGRDLMVQLGLSAYFKSQVMQWYGMTIPMNKLCK